MASTSRELRAEDAQRGFFQWATTSSSNKGPQQFSFPVKGGGGKANFGRRRQQRATHVRSFMWSTGDRTNKERVLRHHCGSPTILVHVFALTRLSCRILGHPADRSRGTTKSARCNTLPSMRRTCWHHACVGFYNSGTHSAPCGGRFCKGIEHLLQRCLRQGVRGKEKISQRHVRTEWRRLGVLRSTTARTLQHLEHA